jgi:hypothetical protein
MCMARPARLVQLKRDYMGDKWRLWHNISYSLDFKI